MKKLIAALLTFGFLTAPAFSLTPEQFGEVLNEMPKEISDLVTINDERTPAASTDGNVIFLNHKFVMWIKDKEQLKFVLAHEYGHYLMGHIFTTFAIQDLPESVQNQVSKKLELQADLFAAKSVHNPRACGIFLLMDDPETSTHPSSKDRFAQCMEASK